MTFAFQMPPPSDKAAAAAFGQSTAAPLPPDEHASQPVAAAPLACGPADPAQLNGLFGGYAAPPDPEALARTAIAQANAITAQLHHAVEVASDVQQAKALDGFGMGHDALLERLDPATRQEVEQQLAAAAAKQHDQDSFEENVRVAKNLDKQGFGHAMVDAGMDPAERQRLEATVAHDEHVDALATNAANMDTLLGSHGAALAGLSEADRKEVEGQLAVRQLTAIAHDDFDQKKLTALLEKLDDPDQRAHVLEEYRKQTGQSLQASINANTGEDSHYRTALGQLISPDRERAERTLGKLSPEEMKEKMTWAREQARKLGGAMFLSKTDKKAMFATLGFQKPEDLEAIRRAFSEAWPDSDGMFNEIDDATSGDSETEVLADMDQSSDGRKKAAAAGMRNAFTGFGRTNDRTRMKELLDKLTPEELDDMRQHPDEYGDILNDVQKTMHGYDKEIVEAYAAGDKALAQGKQLAEDIGAKEITWHSDDKTGAKLDKKALMDKLAKMKPDERAAAVEAYDKTAQRKEEPTIEDMVKDRFDDYNDKGVDYDQDRARALLTGDMITAKAAEAEGAIDRKGTNIDELEEAMSDPDLSSSDPAKKAAAEENRKKIEDKVWNYGNGTVNSQAHDEDKLQLGKDNRVAFDQVMADGKVSMGMELRRAIDDDDTEKGKKLLLDANEKELADARALFAEHAEDWNGSMDHAVRMEWGPTKADGLKVVEDTDSSDVNGNFIEMNAVLNYGERKKWAPITRAVVDKQAHDADRDGPSDAEMAGKSKAGKFYDQAIDRELTAAGSGETGEEFAIKAENTDAASETYLKQKEIDAETKVEHIKLFVTVVTAIFAPELLPLVAPLLTIGGIAYKEDKLGKHYAGENRELKGFVIDSALAATGVAGEAFIEARQVANVAEGVEALETVGNEARTAETVVEGASEARDAESAVASASEAGHAAEEAGAVTKEGAALESEAAAAKAEVKAAEHSAEKAAETGGKVAEGAAGESEDAAAELAEKVKQVEEKYAQAADAQRKALELAKAAGGEIANGVVDDKSFAEIAKGVVVNQAAGHAANFVGAQAGAAFDKATAAEVKAASTEVAAVEHVAEAEATAVEHVAGAEATAATTTAAKGAGDRIQLSPKEVARAGVVGSSQAAAVVAVNVAAGGSTDPDELLHKFGEEALERSGSAAHDTYQEKHGEQLAGAAAEKAAEPIKERIEHEEAEQHGAHAAASEEHVAAAPEEHAAAPPEEHAAAPEEHAADTPETVKASLDKAPDSAKEPTIPKAETVEAAKVGAVEPEVAPPLTPAESEAFLPAQLSAEQQKVLDLAKAMQAEGPLSPQDAQALRELAEEAGLPRQAVPGAATPEDVLRARGVDEATIKLAAEAVKKDAQDNYDRDLPGAKHYDENGVEVVKEPLTDAEKAALIRTHDVLYRDVKPGALVRKFVPEDAVGDMLSGNLDVMKGDVMLGRGTDGLNAADTVAQVGLDYEHASRAADATNLKGGFTDINDRGQKVLSQTVVEHGVVYVDQPLTAQHAADLRVPLGPDLYAYAQESSETPEAYRLKERQSFSSRDANLNAARDPYTGTGHTATNELVDAEGHQIDAPRPLSQEYNSGKNPLQEGAVMRARGDVAGADQAIATYGKLMEDGQVVLGPDGNPKLGWNLSAGLTDEQRAYYEGLIQASVARADARAAVAAAKAAANAAQNGAT